MISDPFFSSGHFHVESYVKIDDPGNANDDGSKQAYLRQVLGNTTIKVHRGHHVLATSSSIDVIHVVIGYCGMVEIVGYDNK